MTLTYQDIDWKNVLIKRYRNYNLTELDVMVIFVSDNVLSLEADSLLTCDLLATYMSAKKDDIDASLTKLMQKKFLVLDEKSMHFSLDAFKKRLFDDMQKDLYLETTASSGESDDSLYDYLEKLSGRTLSPIERDMVSNWIKEGVKEDDIKEACQKSLNKGGSISFKKADKIILDLERSQSRKDLGVSTVNEDTRRQEKIKDILNYDWTYHPQD